MSQEDADTRLLDHVARGAAEDRFPDPAVGVGAHDQESGLHAIHLVEQHLPDGAVLEGLGLGHNALAALMTRGLAEIARLAVALGAQRDTLSGLAGLGDLVLTCTGRLSRNRHVGIELAHGRPLPEILASTKMVAEGVRTTSAALELAARHGVELPIAAQMADVLGGRRDAASAVMELMGRRQRPEN